MLNTQVRITDDNTPLLSYRASPQVAQGAASSHSAYSSIAIIQAHFLFHSCLISQVLISNVNDVQRVLVSVCELLVDFSGC